MTDGEIIQSLDKDGGWTPLITLQKLGWLFCYKDSLHNCKHACMHVSLSCQTKRSVQFMWVERGVVRQTLGFLICYRDSLYKYAHAPFLSHQGCTK